LLFPGEKRYPSDGHRVTQKNRSAKICGFCGGKKINQNARINTVKASGDILEICGETPT